jgi:hypothetical protein
MVRNYLGWGCHNNVLNYQVLDPQHVPDYWRTLVISLQQIYLVLFSEIELNYLSFVLS